MKLKTIVLYVVLIAALITGCTSGINKTPDNQTDSTRTSAPSDWTDFIGTRVAAKSGTIYDEKATVLMKSSETLLFNDYPSIYQAVSVGRADAGMRTYRAARISLLDSGYTNLGIIAIPESVHSMEYGAIAMDQDIIDALNRLLVLIKEDGTHDDMIARWFDYFDPNDPSALPEIPLTGANGTLTVAVSSDYIPFVFPGDNGVLLGFDIELAIRFAEYMDMDIEFVDMAFSGLLPYVISGKADFSVTDITITEERKQSVLFTDPYLTDMSALVYRIDDSITDKNTDTSAGVGLFEWLKVGIERNLITENRWKLITGGLAVTMLIAFTAQISGTVLGCFICYLKTRKSKVVKRIAILYCNLIYGTPVVVLLMITYYIIFGTAAISNVLIAIAAFTMVVGANIAQTLNDSIDTVDPVEIEAARSMGFSGFGAFTTITLPQAIRYALPGYSKGFIDLVKSTAIVGYIAIQDLTRAGDIIRSRTYDAFFPLLFVAVIYLIVTMTCVHVFKRIVKKVNPGSPR